MSFLTLKPSLGLLSPQRASDPLARVDMTRLSAAERAAVNSALHPDFVTQERNPEPQHPVLVAVDSSYSMNGAPIESLNQALAEFARALRNDPLIARSVVIGLAGFGNANDRAFSVLHKFAPPVAFQPPVLSAAGETPHCQRVCELIDFLGLLGTGLRKTAEVPIRHTWYFDFTDGKPTDLHLHQAAMRASRVVAVENDTECFYFGVGPNADLDYLRTLQQPGKEAQLLSQAGDWTRFFSWLHRSIRIASQSLVGDEVELPSIDGDGTFLVRA